MRLAQILLLFFACVEVAAFSVLDATRLRPASHVDAFCPRSESKRTSWRCAAWRGDQDGESASIDDDGQSDDHKESASAYKNRSLAWTNRYRRLIPYESARSRAISLGLRSRVEWDEYQASGEAKEHGPYLPSKPDLMYPEDWTSWEDFLGIMRPYEDARGLVRTLGIQNMDEYDYFIRADKKRAEGLRIPAKPHIVYRNNGWTSFEDFFGSFD